MFEKCRERLERKRFCEVTKMAGVDAAQQTRMKNIRCCVVGGVQPDTVMTIVTMVVAFYFGTQTEGKSNGK